MSPRLSLELLQTLLHQDAERQCVTNAADRTKHRQPLASQIDTLWRNTGVLPGTEAYWMRPMSASLYRCPLSTPSTTLVPWKSLPAAVQAKLRASPGTAILLAEGDATTTSAFGHDSSPGIVEVPLSYLGGGNGAGEDEGGDGSKHRPIQGNLADKLNEYARGMTGQRSRPFRPGGLEEKKAADQVKEDPWRSVQAVERSRKVLEQGSEASWRDKSLITAPPGVNFKHGLTWNDVLGDSDKKASDEKDFHLKEDAITPSTLAVMSPSISTGPDSSKGMFNRSYFDDDSLFGSSSSGSDDDGENDDSATRGEPEQSEGDALVGVFDQSRLSGMAAVDENAADANNEAGDNVDLLLLDLSVLDDKLFMKKMSHDGDVTLNPLELAERQAKGQIDATRKSWATDKLLPIEDFNATVPNPALSYPFTLDAFQQQAVARLERSENVFVAAHTSAGKTVGKCWG